MPRKTRNSTLYGLAAQLMFMVAASRLLLPLEVFYIILFVLLSIQALFFWRDNPSEPVIDTEQYSFVESPGQVLAAIVVTAPIVAPFVVLGRISIPPNLLDEFLTQGIFVSFVETVYMIVTVKTLWYKDRNVGLVAWPVIFGFMHPVVRENWIRLAFPLESFLGFVYAAVFGVFFWVLWAGRETFARRYQPYFGSVTSWTAHLTINMFVIVFPLTLFSLALFPLQGA